MAEILIVEDETAINELLRRNLELVGHRCRSVYDGEAAVEVLEEQAFDLMLLDIMLPGFAWGRMITWSSPLRCWSCWPGWKRF